MGRMWREKVACYMIHVLTHQLRTITNGNFNPDFFSDMVCGYTPFKFQTTCLKIQLVLQVNAT